MSARHALGGAAGAAAVLLGLAAATTACHPTPSVLLELHVVSADPPRETRVRLCDARCERLCNGACEAGAEPRKCSAEKTAVEAGRRDGSVAIFRGDERRFDVEIVALPCGNGPVPIVLGIDPSRAAGARAITLNFDCVSTAMPLGLPRCCTEGEPACVDAWCERRVDQCPSSS